MWTPGTAVGIARNGPPVGRPGFGSNVSSWLAPPASQSRITRFWSALQLAGQGRALQDVERRHVGGTAADRRPRGQEGAARETEHGGHAVLTCHGQLGRLRTCPTLVVKSALAAGEQRPHQLAAGLGQAVGALGEILGQRCQFVIGRRLGSRSTKWPFRRRPGDRRSRPACRRALSLPSRSSSFAIRSPLLNSSASSTPTWKSAPGSSN